MNRCIRRTLFYICLSALTVVLLASCTHTSNIGESSICDQSDLATSAEESKVPSEFKLASVEIKTTFGTTKSEYTYNENGFVSELKQYSNGKVYRIESIKYDAENNISEKKISMPGSNVSDTEEIYFYTSENVLERYESKSGQITTIFLYEYDAQGRIAKITQSDGTATLKESVYEYLDEYGSTQIIADGTRIQKTYYDENKNIVRSYSGNADGTVYEDTSYIHTYEGGQLIKTEAIVSNEVVSVTSYKYDEYGNLLEEKQINEAGTPISTTTYTYYAE